MWLLKRGRNHTQAQPGRQTKCSFPVHHRQGHTGLQMSNAKWNNWAGWHWSWSPWPHPGWHFPSSPQAALPILSHQCTSVSQLKEARLWVLGLSKVKWYKLPQSRPQAQRAGGRALLSLYPKQAAYHLVLSIFGMEVMKLTGGMD